MNNGRHKLAIGFILYGKSTAGYLPYFLPSLKNQIFGDFKIIAFNNFSREEDDNEKYLKSVFPEADILRANKNLGFAGAYNQMINRAFEMGVDYFLVINTDMIMEAEAVGEMIKALKEDDSLGSVSPKILRWDFTNGKKTNIIDTCGIKMKVGLRFFDAGEGEKDREKFYREKIIGPSGAGGLYRMKVMERIKENGKYFDENMFMYKEDCDLAYKVFSLGFKAKCVPEAVFYHDRTVSGRGGGDLAVILNRKNKSKQAKIWSWRGQQIIFIKYWRHQNLWSKINIIFYEIKAFLFALLFERYLIKEFLTIYKEKSNII